MAAFYLPRDARSLSVASLAVVTFVALWCGAPTRSADAQYYDFSYRPFTVGSIDWAGVADTVAIVHNVVAAGGAFALGFAGTDCLLSGRTCNKGVAIASLLLGASSVASGIHTLTWSRSAGTSANTALGVSSIGVGAWSLIQGIWNLALPARVDPRRPRVEVSPIRCGAMLGVSGTF